MYGIPPKEAPKAPQASPAAPEKPQRPADLITPKAAAGLLLVSAGTIHRWVKCGKLRSWRRAGSRWLVSRADALALLVESAPAAPQAPPSLSRVG